MKLNFEYNVMVPQDKVLSYNIKISESLDKIKPSFLIKVSRYLVISFNKLFINLKQLNNRMEKSTLDNSNL